MVARVCLAALAFSEAVSWMEVASGGGIFWLNHGIRWGLMVLSYRVWRRLSQPNLDPSSSLFLARTWLGLLCVGVAAQEYGAFPAVPGLAAAGISRVCLVVALAPVLIPDSLKRSLSYAAVLTTSLPLGYALALIFGSPPLNGLELALRLVSNLVAMAAAWVAAATVQQLREAVAQEYGNYRLVKVLGSGGFGQVWLAHHRLLKREAALKIVNQQGGDAAQRLDRFLREAEALSRLQSPHTIRLFDYGQSEDGRLYYVMELLHGYDLQQLVRDFGPQPPERVVWLLAQACLSLQEAHQVGLVHRDIKPANLFLTRLGVQPDYLKVLDFGLVKPLVADNLTQTDQVVGTPEAMPPEQILGQPLDGRSDLYSLACVGIYLLTGKPLFVREQPMQVLLDHLNTPAPLLGDLPLHRLLAECLQKDLNRRPASAQALYLELQKLPRWSHAQANAWWDQHPPS